MAADTQAPDGDRPGLGPRYREAVNAPPGLDCDQVVELVTDYLEGALDAATAARVEAHLAECPGCHIYVEQIRRTVRTLGAASAASLPGRAQEALIAAFRDFHRRARET